MYFLTVSSLFKKMSNYYRKTFHELIKLLDQKKHNYLPGKIIYPYDRETYCDLIIQKKNIVIIQDFI